MTPTPPFLATADTAIEFIPPSQDAAGYEREEGAALQKREQALERRMAAFQQAVDAGDLGQEEIEAAQAEIDAERDAITDAREILRDTVAEMKARYPKPQTFFLTVPTSVDREQINSRLVSLGLTQVTQEAIRATMIEELFHRSWAEPGEDITPEINEQRAEENANFLDGVWLRQQAHDRFVQEWEEQEVERLLDEQHGAPARPRAELPVKIISVREQARMQLLVETMMTKSQRLRDMAAANMDFARRNSILMVRMHLVGVENIDFDAPIERNRHTRALPEETVIALREKVGDRAWHELVGYIDRMYQVDGAERKNSVSPLEKRSLPSGSTEPSGSLDNSDGSSTGSSSTPVLDAGSVTITEPSSTSTSVSDTVRASTSESSSPTVEG